MLGGCHSWSSVGSPCIHRTATWTWREALVWQGFVCFDRAYAPAVEKNQVRSLFLYKCAFGDVCRFFGSVLTRVSGFSVPYEQSGYNWLSWRNDRSHDGLNKQYNIEATRMCMRMCIAWFILFFIIHKSVPIFGIFLSRQMAKWPRGKVTHYQL